MMFCHIYLSSTRFVGDDRINVMKYFSPSVSLVMHEGYIRGHSVQLQGFLMLKTG